MKEEMLEVKKINITLEKKLEDESKEFKRIKIEYVNLKKIISKFEAESL